MRADVRGAGIRRCREAAEFLGHQTGIGQCAEAQSNIHVFAVQVERNVCRRYLDANISVLQAESGY